MLHPRLGISTTSGSGGLGSAVCVLLLSLPALDSLHQLPTFGGTHSYIELCFYGHLQRRAAQYGAKAGIIEASPRLGG